MPRKLNFVAHECARSYVDEVGLFLPFFLLNGGCFCCFGSLLMKFDFLNKNKIKKSVTF